MAAGLVLAVMFVGCEPGPEMSVVRRSPYAEQASPHRRPVDADPVVAAELGREMLKTLGYARLIELTRQAGFVTRKKKPQDPRREGAALAMGGAPGMDEFVEVFSKYAFMAAVTSQTDSPLPGPMDVVAIGILAMGLLDAGLLQGAIQDALTGTGTLPPLAAATATATPTTTVTSPPIAVPRRRPGQTCDDARLDELEKRKKAACYSQDWSCSDDREKIGKKREKLLTCPELLTRIPIGKACIDARKLVQSECFAGSPDPGHENAIKELTETLNECIRKASIRGPGGGPC